MGKGTLVDQGRDVSRALRNRCLQIDVQYLAGRPVLPGDASAAAEAAGSIVAMQDSRVAEVYHESLKFDLFPVLSDAPLLRSAGEPGPAAPDQAQVQLGKRARAIGLARPPACDAEEQARGYQRPVGGPSGIDAAAYLTRYLSLN